MPERYKKYKALEERMIVMKRFFSEYFRQTISNNAIENGVDFSILELKGLSAFIDHHKEYTMSELSQNAHLPLSNISAIVERLSKKDIAKRCRDTKDRRIVRVHLTSKGKKMLHAFMKKRAEELENSLGSLSEGDRRELFNALEKATEIFQKIKY
jgi:DNA-binding MarR family transcriptional regulator